RRAAEGACAVYVARAIDRDAGAGVDVGPAQPLGPAEATRAGQLRDEDVGAAGAGQVGGGGAGVEVGRAGERARGVDVARAIDRDAGADVDAGPAHPLGPAESTGGGELGDEDVGAAGAGQVGGGGAGVEIDGAL